MSWLQRDYKGQSYKTILRKLNRDRWNIIDKIDNARGLCELGEDEWMWHSMFFLTTFSSQLLRDFLNL